MKMGVIAISMYTNPEYLKSHLAKLCHMSVSVHPMNGKNLEKEEIIYKLSKSNIVQPGFQIAITCRKVQVPLSCAIGTGNFRQSFSILYFMVGATCTIP